MIITLRPTADASIYQRYPNVNTGYDQILEIGKLKADSDDTTVYSGSSSVVSLINFDVSDAATWSPTASIYLKLRIASASQLNRNQTIIAYAPTSSWTEGSGYFIQQPYNPEDGASWNSMGTKYTSAISASHTLNSFPLEDISIDVSSLVRSAISSSTWNGIAVSLTSADQQNGEVVPNIRVFSSQTHTIHAPTLEVIWNSQVYSTGSLKQLPAGEIEVAYKNIKQQYIFGSKELVYIVIRDKYPTKAFDNTPRYQGKYCFPATSYYRIRDVTSNTLINDFTDGTRVNCSSNYHSFLLDTTSLYSGRYYKVEFKIVKSNGEILMHSPDEIFTVK